MGLEENRTRIAASAQSPLSPTALRPFFQNYEPDDGKVRHEEAAH
jgi:hypothetical protein